ncbi:MAG: hypothetical protein Q9175_005848 [Cornicularia normoerica]
MSTNDQILGSVDGGEAPEHTTGTPPTDNAAEVSSQQSDVDAVDGDAVDNGAAGSAPGPVTDPSLPPNGAHPFSDLPVEVLGLITVNLDTIAHHSLRLCSKSIRAHVDAPTIMSHGEFIRFHKQLEAHSPRKLKHLLCPYCNTFKKSTPSKATFTDAQAVQKYSGKRACIECGIANGHYNKRDVVIKKKKFFVCGGCKLILTHEKEDKAVHDVVITKGYPYRDSGWGRGAEITFDSGGKRWFTLLQFRQCLLRTSRNGALPHRTFHASLPRTMVRPFLLSDIGEGIKEVQIIQWFVEPGARVEQFDKICEVQSDKATTEITSRFDGVIKKRHYEAEDVAQVGKPLCDIDVQSDISPEDEAILAPPAEQAGSPSDPQQPQKAAEQQQLETPEEAKDTARVEKRAALATPAVRGLLRELNVNIADVSGTGKDGRVTKDDVQKFVATQKSEMIQSMQPQSTREFPDADQAQVEKPITLTPVQSQMFKMMTRSLSIPHFLYADEINVTALSTLRQRLNNQPSSADRLSYLPFIIKAVSLALEDFPLLNAQVDTGTGENAPKLVMREKHNIGVAMDTPQGLLVPNIKDVSARSILGIASEVSRIQALAKDGKLSVTDLTGGTVTVSNVGSIGGTYVAPVLVQSEVAILGIGKARVIPAFDDHDRVVKKDVINLSWSADHRVVDGATMARMAERVRAFIEEPALMMTRLR